MVDTSIELLGLEEISNRFKSILRGLADVSDLTGEIGNYLVASILMRTSEGQDVHDEPFDPYSRSYRRIREAKGLPTTPDLFFTGQLTSSLTYEETKDQVEVFFMDTPRRGSDNSVSNTRVFGSGETDLSNPEVAFYVNEIREFFGISSDERSTVIRMVNDYVRSIIRNERR